MVVRVSPVSGDTLGKVPGRWEVPVFHRLCCVLTSASGRTEISNWKVM